MADYGRIFACRVENGLNDHNPDSMLSRMSNVRVIFLTDRVEPYLRKFYILPKYHPLMKNGRIYEEFVFDVFANDSEEQQLQSWVHLVESWILDNKAAYLRLLHDIDILGYYETLEFVRRETRVREMGNIHSGRFDFNPLTQRRFIEREEPARELTRKEKFIAFFKFIFR